MTYVLAKDYEKIHRAQVTCSSIVKGIEPLLREQGISSQVKLVGSAANGLITYNGKNHTFDFDYNLFVKNAIEWDTAYLHDQVRLCMNQSEKEHIAKNGLLRRNPYSFTLSYLGRSSDVHESTSALTSKPMYFLDDPMVRFHIDLAIITEIDQCWQRLKFDKNSGHFIWNKMSNIDSFKKHEAALTSKERVLIPERYLAKKNQHIREEEHFPSFKCYMEAINEIYYGVHCSGKRQ